MAVAASVVPVRKKGDPNLAVTVQDDEDSVDVEASIRKPIPIAELTARVTGITENDVKKLKENGYYTVESVVSSTKRQLVKIHGFSDAKVDKIVKAAKELRPLELTTAYSHLKFRNDVILITTGSEQLNKLLGGGIETGSITELAGEFRTGKTQLCHSLAATCQLAQDKGGCEAKCFYIDTEGTFRPERVCTNAERFGLDSTKVLDNISYCRVFSTDQLFEVLKHMNAMMAAERYGLVIVDSSTSLFRAEFEGRGELAERQNLLGQFLYQLKKMTIDYGVAAVITNQMVSDVSGTGAGFVSDPKKPIGGNIMAHAMTTRLLLKKGREDNRICQVTASPLLPEDQATFRITIMGIEDAED